MVKMGNHPKSLLPIKKLERYDVYYSRSFNRQRTYKYLFLLQDGSTVESAAYQHYQNDLPVDLSIDISSMVGCPMKCKFCESASIAYRRTLKEGEMLSQVFMLVSEHDKIFPKITCSFQGIGEPSLIPEKVLNVSNYLVNVSSRYEVSISTIGEKPAAFKIWRDHAVEIDSLQLSCSGTSESKVATIMPRSPSINKLIDEILLCSESPNINKTKFNYILINGFNDSSLDIETLVNYFRGTSVTVKISALNPTRSSTRYMLSETTYKHATEIKNKLIANDIDCYVYGAFNDIAVSCGQLTHMLEI